MLLLEKSKYKKCCSSTFHLFMHLMRKDLLKIWLLKPKNACSCLICHKSSKASSYFHTDTNVVKWNQENKKETSWKGDLCDFANIFSFIQPHECTQSSVFELLHFSNHDIQNLSPNRNFSFEFVIQLNKRNIQHIFLLHWTKFYKDKDLQLDTLANLYRMRYTQYLRPKREEFIGSIFIRMWRFVPFCKQKPKMYGM